jgi:hypothetical protein
MMFDKVSLKAVGGHKERLVVMSHSATRCGEMLVRPRGLVGKYEFGK